MNETKKKSDLNQLNRNKGPICHPLGQIAEATSISCFATELSITAHAFACWTIPRSFFYTALMSISAQSCRPPLFSSSQPIIKIANPNRRAIPAHRVTLLYIETHKRSFWLSSIHDGEKRGRATLIQDTSSRFGCLWMT